MTVKEFLSALPGRLVWKTNPATLGEALLFLAIYPLVCYAVPVLFEEDGWVENLQLVVLTVAFLIAVRAKTDKKFFYMAAMIVVLLLMRETNLGRSYFCAKYLAPDEMCRWKNMKYGFIMEPLRGVFALYICYFFVKNKLWRSLWTYLASAPIFVWDILLLFAGAVVGTVAEFESVDNEVLEECGEMLFYIAFTNCLWRYSRIKPAE